MQSSMMRSRLIYFDKCYLSLQQQLRFKHMKVSRKPLKKIVPASSSANFKSGLDRHWEFEEELVQHTEAKYTKTRTFKNDHGNNFDTSAVLGQDNVEKTDFLVM